MSDVRITTTSINLHLFQNEIFHSKEVASFKTILTNDGVQTLFGGKLSFIKIKDRLLV